MESKGRMAREGEGWSTKGVYPDRCEFIGEFPCFASQARLPLLILMVISISDAADGCILRRKRFICIRCDRRYVNSRDLKRHEKYGCGRSPRFKCPYCSQRAKYRSVIYNHVRAIHPRMHVMTVDLGSDTCFA
ncbi:Longitudinals lacking protein, isoforms F/I/K/T [Ooceraea biroi]|uniref:Longitudinals lacking protein, isoforms F/I/K/T n=1 Tax=Ooceraea biroi TaxID=2015173 RepID=A0A026W5A3_OOCBI|nr:Longitudinals lacking protein, isoforms F/I/K/T [Ooceraea biroi]